VSGHGGGGDRPHPPRPDRVLSTLSAPLASRVITRRHADAGVTGVRAPRLTHQLSLVYSPPVPTATLDLTRAARLFHALSDETRLAVLEMLGDGERCVCDLQDALEAAQSRLSFHLKVLKEAGLVVDRKEGRWSYYALVPDALGEAHDIVRTLATGGAGRRARLKVLGRCCD